MFETSKHLIACALLLAFGQQAYAQDFDPSSYCVLVPDNTNFANIEDCSSYYTCSNGVALLANCSSGQYYNKNTRTCTTSSSVCTQNIDPCVGTTGEQFMPMPGNCQGYIYCLNGVNSGSGICPNNMNFINGECTYNPCPNTGSPQLDSLCQIFPNDVYFGSFSDCKEWQICKSTSPQPINGSCNGEFVFDTQILQCNYISSTVCDGRGSALPPGGSTCDTEGATTYNPDVCGNYYVCQSSTWQSRVCATGQYYSLITSSCVLRQTALPYYTCDRCAGSTDTFVNAVDPSCNSYLYCSNGVEKGNGTCSVGSIFNEDLGACVAENEIYQQQNGACTPCLCETNTSGTCADKYSRPSALCPCVTCGTTPAPGVNTTVAGNATTSTGTETTVTTTTLAPGASTTNASTTDTTTTAAPTTDTSTTLDPTTDTTTTVAPTTDTSTTLAPTTDTTTTVAPTTDTSTTLAPTTDTTTTVAPTT